MERVYSSESVAMAWHVSNVLEQYDIATHIRNDKLHAVAGELPVNECLAEVWVLQKLDTRRALQIIAEMQQDPDQGPDWQCRSCGETSSGNFAICWNCQQPLANAEDELDNA